MATVTSKRRRPSSLLPPGVPRDGRLSIDIPLSACTLAGFRAWTASDSFPGHVRAAFTDQGIFIDTSQEELETHVKVKMEISRVLLNLMREVDLGEVYGDGTQIANEGANLASQPDAVFVRWESLDSGQVRLVPRTGAAGQYMEVDGRPDWVLEVVSNSSVQKDTEQLRIAYHRAGIAEYWLVDARGDDIVFQVLHWRKKGYAAAPRKDGWQQSKVFRRWFRLVRQQGRRGLWRYTLEMRAG